MGRTYRLCYSNFFPRILQKRPESRPESKRKPLNEKVLNFLKNGPLSISEFSDNLGHKCISGGLKKTLRTLMDSGKIEHTIPDKKESPSMLKLL